MKSKLEHKIKKKALLLLHSLTQTKRWSALCYLIAYLPFLNQKHKNLFLNLAEQQKGKEILQSYPYKVCLNITNSCNLRCKFCEIHYFYWKAKQRSGKVFPNALTINFIKRFADLFEKISIIELSGATGEPFLNKNFLLISDYLTNKLGIFCSATTNGTLITQEITERLIKTNFGTLLFSIHGANQKMYQEFQGGDLAAIFKKIKMIQARKKKWKRPYPLLGVNFLLSQKNTAGIFSFLDKLKGVDLDFLNLNHYYDSRNRLPREISFYFDQEKGNKITKRIYDYASKINLRIQPSNPPLLTNPPRKKRPQKFCSAPFDSLKFKGCPEYKNCNYIAVCNRINLFRLNYQEFFKQRRKFKEIWNHELLQFFRKTSGKNPVCRFCRHPQTPQIRCEDYPRYARQRDLAIRQFFQEFQRRYPNYAKIKGLDVLSQNPYQYENHEGF